MSGLCRDCLTRDQSPAGRCARCGSHRRVVHDELDRLAIAHMDCDAFYASVEKRDRPELRDQPVIVGGGKRGVVSTCCYIARIYGVRSAMPMFQALRLCPQAVVLKPDFAKYKADSRRIMEKLEALTPLVQPLSLDEAWLDLSGCERLHGGPAAWVLARLQAEIEREVGITVSVGLAPNKFLAKIASDLDKPRGFSVIGAAEAKSFLATKPVRILPGVGPALAASLEKQGFRTVGDLARAEPKALAARWGSHGLRLSQLAAGEDSRIVDPEQARKSISAETTFMEDLSGLERLEDRLLPLCERVARTARREGVAGRVASLKLKTAGFQIISRRRTLPAPTQTAKVLFATAREMLAAEVGAGPFRLIGAGLSDFVDAAEGLDLFADTERRARKSETAIDALRGKFGAGAVVTGRVLKGE
ncbi:DNA polymerase IV [Phenylobacterium montanum]|uniref:DNA polymerase IV n=1 Tax=Phenylobacterium montanum TaxID=2823693 RepID=A0A975G074_9CAUL|nr:DNA polymerase IV [Caulobacter sp. S6]QUD88179.1 DNA polymerase IV [Caulobacter sp. S6]